MSDLRLAVSPRPDRRPEIVSTMLAEFIRSPRLALTSPQARRLWHIDAGTCAHLLDWLVDEQVLSRRADGRYVIGPAIGQPLQLQE